ncbi:DUF6527 family protein [Pseudomonas aeruginosa]|uniref:DUF6527 family protein n=1 Tax=Pseudomonas aeruginosa TaxID=287 RepID=UPI003D2C54DE
MSGYVTLSPILAESNGKLSFFCPACQYPHSVTISPDTPGPKWMYDGNADAPTFTPSILVRTGSAVDPTVVWEEGDPPRVCHSFVRGGKIQYLNDCDHPFAGKTVAIPPFPYFD